MSWLENEIERTDLGLFSAILWIVILFGFGGVIALIGCIGIKINIEYVIAGYLSVVLFGVYQITKKLTITKANTNKYAIYIISLVIVHSIGFSMAKHSGKIDYTAMLSLQLLVYPAFVIHAIICYNIYHKLTLGSSISIMIAVLEVAYCLKNIG